MTERDSAGGPIRRRPGTNCIAPTVAFLPQVCLDCTDGRVFHTRSSYAEHLKRAHGRYWNKRGWIGPIGRPAGHRDGVSPQAPPPAPRGAGNGPLLGLCRPMPHVLGLRRPVPSSCETRPCVPLLLGLRCPVPLLLRLWRLVLLVRLRFRRLMLLFLGLRRPVLRSLLRWMLHRSPLLLLLCRRGRGYRPTLASSPHRLLPPLAR